MQSSLSVLQDLPETGLLGGQERMLNQLSGGEAIVRQPLHTMFYEVDGKLAHFVILDRREQALKAHVWNCVNGVDPLAFFVPVDSGDSTLFKERLRRWTEKGMVLG